MKYCNVSVERRGKEDNNKLIDIFLKKVKNEKIIQEYRDRMYYEKPTDKRRRLKLKRANKLKKIQEENNG